MDERETMTKLDDIALKAAYFTVKCNHAAHPGRHNTALLNALEELMELRTLRSVEPAREMLHRAWLFLDYDLALLNLWEARAMRADTSEAQSMIDKATKLATLLTTIRAEGHADGRAEAIEECAKVADKMQEAAAGVLAEKHDDDAAAQHDTAMEIATALRSLSTPARS